VKRALLLLVVSAAACGGSNPGVAATAVTLDEGSIIVAHSTLAGGRVTLDIGNVGEFGHTLVVTTDDGVVVAATGLVPAGTTATLEVDLAPGGYQFSCRIVSVGPDGALFDHHQMGMRANVTVRQG
jgi:plastocyanin